MKSMEEKIEKYRTEDHDTAKAIKQKYERTYSEIIKILKTL
jgi:hypothetical protein